MTTNDLASSLMLPSGAVLANRIAKSAMSERMSAPDCAPSEELIRLYETWSAGGAGLLITGNVMVDRNAIAETSNVAVEDERHLGALRAWAAAGKLRGNALWMQINHPGRQVPRMVSRRPVAPSAVQVKMAGIFARPRALESREIEAIVERFGRTAAVAKSAGFSGVQIHAAHGYLISQFLSPLTNQRTDAWGGDADRRRRFLLEVVRCVRAAVGKDMPVGIKLNSADFQRGGFDQAESMAVIEALSAEGIDLIEISGGTYESAAMFQETVPKAASSRRREAFFLEYAEKVRDITRVPLMVTGGFRTRAGMQQALASGATDVVGMARPLALEPTLPRRLLNGTADAAKPIRLSTGIKMLDGLIQGAFYQAQIRRMGAGLEPLPTQSRLLAAIAYLSGNRTYTPVTRQLPEAAAVVVT